jgi:hypothetical protein
MPTFQELRTLITLLDEHGQQPLPLLGRLERQPGKETALFENIRQGKYSNDAQAAADLYGGAAPGKSYAMLKARLYEKLLNGVIFLDFNDAGFLPHAAKEQECLTLLHQAKMLINSGNKNLAEDLLKKAFAIAQELGFTALCLDCLEQLRYVYGWQDRVADFCKNREQLAHFRAVAAYEREAEDLYQAIRLEMRTGVHVRKKYLAELPPVLSQLNAWWKLHHSANVFDFKYKLHLWYYELVGDFQGIIQACAEAREVIQGGLLHPLRLDQRNLKYMEVYAYLRIGDYERGLQMARESARTFLPSTANWFAHTENYFLLAMHAQQYQLAVDLLARVHTNPTWHKLTPRAQEKWRLYGEYLRMVYHSTAEADFWLPGTSELLPGQLTKDKEGFNVAILILQFLRDLRLGDVHLLSSRMESLNQYTKRYLSKHLAMRSRLFIRLLSLIPLYRDNAALCRKKGEKLLAQLMATPSPGDAYAEIEIVPYEHLWEWVLNEMGFKSGVKFA